MGDLFALLSTELGPPVFKPLAAFGTEPTVFGGTPFSEVILGLDGRSAPPTLASGDWSATFYSRVSSTTLVPGRSDPPRSLPLISRFPLLLRCRALSLVAA